MTEQELHIGTLVKIKEQYKLHKNEDRTYEIIDEVCEECSYFLIREQETGMKDIIEWAELYNCFYAL